MIRAIVAMDGQQGIAREGVIPWDIPRDKQYFRDKTEAQTVLMGYQTYVGFVDGPLPNRRNYVWCRPGTVLSSGFTAVYNLDEFLAENPDTWIIGGAGLYTEALTACDELYITHVEGDFGCDRFFPDISGFREVSNSEPITENGYTFNFSVWKPKNYSPRKSNLRGFG